MSHRRGFGRGKISEAIAAGRAVRVAHENAR